MYDTVTHKSVHTLSSLFKDIQTIIWQHGFHLQFETGSGIIQNPSHFIILFSLHHQYQYHQNNMNSSFRSCRERFLASHKYNHPLSLTIYWLASSPLACPLPPPLLHTLALTPWLWKISFLWVCSVKTSIQVYVF